MGLFNHYTKNKDWSSLGHSLTLYENGNVVYTVDLAENMKHKYSDWLHPDPEHGSDVYLIDTSKRCKKVKFKKFVVTFDLDGYGYVISISTYSWISMYETSEFTYTKMNKDTDVVVRSGGNEFSIYNMMCTAQRLGKNREYNEDGTYFNASFKNSSDFVTKMDDMTVMFNSTKMWYDRIMNKVEQEAKVVRLCRKNDWDSKKYALTMIMDGQEICTVDLTEKISKRRTKNWIRCTKELKKRIVFDTYKLVHFSLPFVDIRITLNLNYLGYVEGISIWGTGSGLPPFPSDFNLADLNDTSDIILRLDGEEFSIYDITNMANMLRDGYKVDGSYFTVNTHAGSIPDSLSIDFDSTKKWSDMINEKIWCEE